MANRNSLIKSRLRRKLAEKRSSFADEFEYRLLCEFNHGFHKSPTMWEVERVAISMSNNAEEAIHQRVKDGAISQADATSFLASDTVQLHAKRWRRVTRQSKPLSEMSVQEALLGVEEMSKARIWPDPCTLSMRCYLFSRWRPDKVTPFAATANGDVCVSVVNCPPATERFEDSGGGGGGTAAGGDEGDSEEYFLVDTHDFGLHIQQDVEGRVIQTLKDKQQEALVINGTQTMGAWIHANETTVQFNLTSLMVCVPQADLMRWKQPRQTLAGVVAQQQARYKDAVRAHLMAGGVLRPRRSLNGEKVVEAVFQLDNGSELCADFERPGVFDAALPQRSTWSTLEDVPSSLKGLPKTAKVFKAPEAAAGGASLLRSRCDCAKCVAAREQDAGADGGRTALDASPAPQETPPAAKPMPSTDAPAGGGAAPQRSPPAQTSTTAPAPAPAPAPAARTSKRSKRSKRSKAKAVAAQSGVTSSATASPPVPPPADSVAPDTRRAAAPTGPEATDTPSTPELSPLAAAFGSSLEDAVQRAGRTHRSGGLRVSSAYAASLGLDIDAGDSVRIGEERGGGTPTPPTLPPQLSKNPSSSHSSASSGLPAGSSSLGSAGGVKGSPARPLHPHADGLSLDGPVANLSVPSALEGAPHSGGGQLRGFAGGLPGSESPLGGGGLGGFGLGSGSLDPLHGLGHDHGAFQTGLAHGE